MHTSSSGGSSDSDVQLFAVSPTGADHRVRRAVTIAPDGRTAHRLAQVRADHTGIDGAPDAQRVRHFEQLAQQAHDALRILSTCEARQLSPISAALSASLAALQSARGGTGRARPASATRASRQYPWRTRPRPRACRPGRGRRPAGRHRPPERAPRSIRPRQRQHDGRAHLRQHQRRKSSICSASPSCEGADASAGRRSRLTTRRPDSTSASATSRHALRPARCRGSGAPRGRCRRPICRRAAARRRNPYSRTGSNIPLGAPAGEDADGFRYSQIAKNRTISKRARRASTSAAIAGYPRIEANR